MTRFVKFLNSSLLTLGHRFSSSSSTVTKNTRLCAATTAAGVPCIGTSIYLRQCRCHNDSGHQHRNPSGMPTTPLLAASLAFLNFFFKNEDEEKEPELITTIKRSVLLIQKGEFKKAEQMLHLALNQAQTVENEQGVTYVYDVMANLAFEIGEYEKAQKLFTAVMQRLLADGVPLDDLRIVTMSLKMAKILEHKRDYDNAENAYKYCLKILQEHIDQGTEDFEIISIWAMNIDWYAHLLLNIARYTEALRYMKKAYELCVKLNGEVYEQSVVLLNDLGSISFMKGNLDDAVDYLTKAAETGDKLPEMEDIAAIHTNLGNVYIKKGLLDEAKRACQKGWKLSRKTKNDESMKEAKLCLEEVSKLLSK